VHRSPLPSSDARGGVPAGDIGGGDGCEPLVLTIITHRRRARPPVLSIDMAVPELVQVARIDSIPLAERITLRCLPPIAVQERAYKALRAAYLTRGGPLVRPREPASVSYS
jgi:hypothetical protein